MKKRFVGILSLNINTMDFNYGAILHSWAFQKYLKKYADTESEVVDYLDPRLENYNRRFPLFNLLKRGQKRKFLRVLFNLGHYGVRYKKFDEFEKNHMVVSEKTYTQKTLRRETLKYDTLVCESDVIWSAGHSGGKYDPVFFLALDNMKNKKKIAYSPSMGDDIPSSENRKRDFKRLLSSLDYISCRESYEVDIIKKYTKKEVVHVVDPVMLLEAEDFDEICAPRMVDEKYALLYLPVDDNAELREAAIKYANEKNLKVVEIATTFKDYKNVDVLKSAGVEEFLSLVKNAEVVFTNSFHAICFSVIFNREFYVFTRSYNGKIRDICETLGLSERFLSDNIFSERKKLDYKKINKKVDKWRLKSRKWINTCLED